MKLRLPAACVLLLVIVTPASAHRLDEYLQATTLSLARDTVQAQIRLTPGVAVYPSVITQIDTNADGTLSQSEQKAYAERVLDDLSLTLDGKNLRLRLISWKFTKTNEMKSGLGDIQLDFNATVPQSGPKRRLVFVNHHQSRIAVYLVNCLVPNDPNIQVTAQKRNYQQSSYELNYTQLSPAKRPGILAWLGTALLILSAPFIFLRRSTKSRPA